jgi:hypothetical protein
MDNGDLLDDLLSRGLAAEVHEILCGVSSYSTTQGEELNESESRSFSSAIAHVDYIRRFGWEAHQDEVINLHGRNFYTLLKEYQEWVGNGAPGLDRSGLENLFRSLS